jgi:hypothetical protein
MKLFDIHHKLAIVFDKEAYVLASVKHCIYELKTGRTILTNET